jgi:hypothetical protein
MGIKSKHGISELFTIKLAVSTKTALITLTHKNKYALNSSLRVVDGQKLLDLCDVLEIPIQSHGKSCVIRNDKFMLTEVQKQQHQS